MVFEVQEMINNAPSVMIKKSFETVFSWWQVFLNQLPISIFEAGEQISEENNQCMVQANFFINKMEQVGQSSIQL